jgi:hypothetical protein
VIAVYQQESRLVNTLFKKKLVFHIKQCFSTLIKEALTTALTRCTPTEVETVLVATQVEHRDEDVIDRLLARTLSLRASVTDFFPPISTSLDVPLF